MSERSEIPIEVFGVLIEEVMSTFYSRLYRGANHGAAPSQHLPAPVFSDQRDSQSSSGLHQGHPLHHGAQDPGFTCYRHGEGSCFFFVLFIFHQQLKNQTFNVL